MRVMPCAAKNARARWTMCPGRRAMIRRRNHEAPAISGTYPTGRSTTTEALSIASGIPRTHAATDIQEQNACFHETRRQKSALRRPSYALRY